MSSSEDDLAAALRRQQLARALRDFNSDELSLSDIMRELATAILADPTTKPTIH